MELMLKRFSISFTAAILGLLGVGILINSRTPFVKPHLDKFQDCTTCGPQFDKQLPMIETLLRIFLRSGIPDLGVCDQCQLSFDGHLKRMGDFCVTPREDGLAIDKFEVLIPLINVTCSCGLNFSTSIKLPDTRHMQCVDQFPTAAKALRLSHDTTMEELQICQNLASSLNSPEMEKRKSRLTLSLSNFRLRFNVHINKTRHVHKLFVRLSHMSPGDFRISCRGDLHTDRLCHCLQNDHVLKLSYYTFKTLVPCFINNVKQFQTMSFFKDFGFCFPDKLINLT